MSSELHLLLSCPSHIRSLKKGRRPGSIGFVADERRINVGLTRARCSLIVIGNAKALQVNGNWAGLIYQAMKDKYVRHGGISGFRFCLLSNET
jgi:superfamily I DNA and/or RNA helicase